MKQGKPRVIGGRKGKGLLPFMDENQMEMEFPKI